MKSALDIVIQTLNNWSQKEKTAEKLWKQITKRKLGAYIFRKGNRTGIKVRLRVGALNLVGLRSTVEATFICTRQ